MKKSKESFFWTSYSDLMTSLFIIMLVLFVLVIVLLNKRMEATIIELEDIKKVEASTRDLEGKYFTYNKEYEKFILNYYKKEHPLIKSSASQINWQLDDGIDYLLPRM